MFVGEMRLLDGVRGVIRSEAAMSAATTKATVVKKPKVFWMRVMELCMLGNLGTRLVRHWVVLRVLARTG